MKTAQCVKIGDVAGGLGWSGYIQISIDNKTYLAHRLAWLYVYGDWPSKDIDHRDGNRLNNAIENLRLATQSQNIANAKRRSANPSGFKGVTRCSRTNKWRARITVNYIERYLGTFDTAEEAHVAYAAAAESAFGTFARVR